MPFQTHVELLQFFLAHRAEIVERIQGLLNAQRKPVEYLQDGSALSRHLEDCFFIGATASQAQLRGELEEAHWAAGFRPRALPGLHNGLVDPAEMMIRGFHLWQQTRWPGRNGRVHYAQTLFNLYLIRCLELLSMRLWDAGGDTAGDRLAQVQAILDQLRAATPAGQPVFIRDARWLIPMAQSPATDELGAYFDVAEKIAGSLSQEDRLEIHTANVQTAGGHLRAQIRYHALKKGVALDDTTLILNTRNTNALDFALLVQDLVPLLGAYEDCCRADDGDRSVRLQADQHQGRRLALADAICQAISPDPELFLNRVELLGAYSMIEHLFITSDGEGRVNYTPMGQRHVQMLEEYAARISRAARSLLDDCPNFRPAAGTYSPYGVLFGFATDLIEHMALKSLAPDAAKGFTLEDVFTAGDAGKLAWVVGWRKLPHLPAEVVRQFDYPQQFAEDVFARIEQALTRRVAPGAANADDQTGRLFIASADDLQGDANTSSIPELPVRYIQSSDPQIVAAGTAEACDDTQLSSDRREARCVVSYRTPGGWVAISKTMLTEVLGSGRSVKVVGLPPAAAGALALLCRDLVVREGS